MAHTTRPQLPHCSVIPGNPSTEHSGQINGGSHEPNRETTACFDRRGTMEALSASDAESRSFYLDADLQARWGAYLRRGQFLNPPPLDFEDIGERIRAFLGPVRESILAEAPFELAWFDNGPWQADVDQNKTSRSTTGEPIRASTAAHKPCSSPEMPGTESVHSPEEN